MSADRPDPVRDDFAAMMARVPVGPAEGEALWRRLTGPDRHYHDARHVAALWRLHQRFAAEAGFDAPLHARLVASAVAYHDAVYVAGRPDNEALSADLWLADSAAGDMPAPERQWVAATIRATADHLAAEAAGGAEDASRLRHWVLDLDLASLGAPPAEFDENTRRLRQEAAALSEADWRDALGRFMRHLDASPLIFRTPILRDAFEAQARKNIQACLSRL